MNTSISLQADQTPPEGLAQAQGTAAKTVNWSRVAWFVGLAFGLTWLLDLWIYLIGGLANPQAKMLLQFQMLLPAFSALLLETFFFKDSSVYFRSNRGVSRWFVYFYFLLTALYLAGAIVSLLSPVLETTVASLLLIPNLVGLTLLVVLRLIGGKDTFVAAGMAGGRVRIWFGFGAGLVIFSAIQAGLNLVFKLGTPVDLNTTFPQTAASNLSPLGLLSTLALSILVVGPFLGLIITFGEEYGWRGFLQSELVRLGRRRGILLLGTIWGIWHWPVIWMGYNYPGQPVLGSLMMVAYCIILAYFLAYAVFKSKGLWTAAYLHALNNQAFSFFMLALVAPSSTLFSFGLGLPGLALGGVVVLLLLRDPIWTATD